MLRVSRLALATFACTWLTACSSTGTSPPANSPDCPAPSFIPMPGAACSKDSLSCTYPGSCGAVALSCTGMQWKQQSGPTCPASPPTDGQSCCLPDQYTCYYPTIPRCEQVCSGGAWVAGQNYCDVGSDAGSSRD